MKKGKKRFYLLLILLLSMTFLIGCTEKVDDAVKNEKDETPVVEETMTYLRAESDAYYLEVGDDAGVQTKFVLCTESEDGSITEEAVTDLTYKMYNHNIAAVDENGLLKPKFAGPTTLTATYGDVSCTVDVFVGTILIRTPEDWLLMIQETDNLESYYYVMEDLDFAGVRYAGFDEVSGRDASKCFRGTVNGGKHTISNITLKTSEGSLGIFGPLMDAKISDLEFDKVTVTSDGALRNGCGFAPTIYGHGASIRDISLDLHYAKKASGNSSVFAANIEDCGTISKVLVSVTSPSGNTKNDGIRMAGNCGPDFAMTDVVVMCQGAPPTNLISNVTVFTDKMDAIWNMNSTQRFGTGWCYTPSRLPALKGD